MLRLLDEVQGVVERYGTPLQQARLYMYSAVAILRKNRYSASLPAIELARTNVQLLEAAGEVGALPAAQFQFGLTVLWAGNDIATAEQAFHQALTLAEQRGDISLQGRCLTYLTVSARLSDALEQVAGFAERSLQVAEAGQMHDYIGAAHGNFAWLAWRAGDLATARAQGKQALAAWERLPAPYMFQWIGRLPMMALALTDDHLEEAIVHARVLLDERQKRMLPAIESALESAVRAADADVPGASRTFLEQAAAAAKQSGYL